MHIEARVLVDAPAGTVFAALSDIGNWARIIPAVREIEMITPLPPRQGSRFRLVRRMYGRTAVEEMTVAVLEPPARLVLTGNIAGAACRIEHRLRHTGHETDLAMVFTGRPVTWAARLLLPLAALFVPTLQARLEADLAAIKAEAERRAR